MVTVLHRMIVAAVATMFLVSATALADDISEVKGSLFIAGGELRYDNAPVWECFRKLAGGKGAMVIVVPAASSEPQKISQADVENFRHYGLKADVVPIAPKWTEREVNSKAAAADPANVDKLRRADGIWFCGGDQSRITRALLETDGKKTPALEAIWEAYRKGAVIGGTSAGTAIMSRQMFTDPKAPLNMLKYGIAKEDVGPGLGFVGDEWFVDQHFLVRGRFARALRAIDYLGYQYGIGVDEDTALVLKEGKFEVIGYKGALVLNRARAETDAHLGEFNLKGVRLTYLDSGDSIDVRTREVKVSAGKQAGKKLEPGSKDFHPYYGSKVETFPDMLSAWAVYTAMYHVIDSRGGVAEGIALDPWDKGIKGDLGFKFRFYRCGDTDGWFSKKNGNTSYTVRNVYLDITPVRLAQPLYKPLMP